VAGTEKQQALDFLVERELAQRWRVSVRTLQRWRGQGSGPGWLKIGGRVIYPLPEILELEEQVRGGTGWRESRS
jgi:hypothetical protein